MDRDSSMVTGLVVAGPLAAALAGGGAGAASGGLIGALVGWGIPEERVKHHAQGIKEGGILMGVKPRSDAGATHFEEEWNGESRRPWKSLYSINRKRT